MTVEETSTADNAWQVVRDGFLWLNVAFLVFWLISLVSAVVATKKAGFSGWLGVLIVGVPVIGPLVMLVLVLLKWPLQKERDRALDALDKAGLDIDGNKKPVEAAPKPAIKKAPAKDSGEAPAS